MALEQSGVEFVIENLGNFMSGMEKASGATGGLTGALQALHKVTEVGNSLVSLGIAISTLAPEIGLVVMVFGSLISVAGRVAEAIGGTIGKAISIAIAALKGLYNIVSSILRPITNFVGGILNALNPLRIFKDLLDRIAYISLGILVADVFRSISRGVADMAKEAVTAASNFQLLNIQLQSFAARDIIEAMDDQQREAADYGEIYRSVAASVKEAADWISYTAAISPFTIEDVTTVYALARSYGFAEEMAKGMVTTITTFAAAMGLSNTEMKRIVINMGQMQQLGKITQRELNDLARGSFVPVNDILEQMAKNLDVTTEELHRMMTEGTVGVEDFNAAFSQLVARDYPEALRKMFATMPGISSALSDITKSLIGFRVLGPTFDFLADKLATIFIDILQDPRLYTLMDTLGADLEGLAESLWPDITGESIVDILVNGYDKLKGLVKLFKAGEWKTALTELGVPDWVITSIDNLRLGFENLKLFWDNNKEPMIAAFNELMDALGIDISSDTFVGLTEQFIKFGDWLNAEGPGMITTLRDVIIPTIEHFVSVTLPAFISALGGARDISIPANQYEGLGKLGEAMEKIDLFAVGFGTFLDRLILIGQANFKSFWDLALAIDHLSTALGGEAGEGFVDKLSDFILVITAAPGVAMAGIAFVIDSIATSIDTLRIALAIFQATVGTFFTGFMEGIQGGRGLVGGAAGGFLNVMEMFQPIKDEADTTAAEVGTAFNFDAAKQNTETFTGDAAQSFRDLSNELVGNSIVPDMMTLIYDSINTKLASTVKMMDNYRSKFAGVGAALGRGFGNGLLDELESVLAKVVALVQQILDEMAAVADIASPSKKTMYMGRMLMAGLAKGMEQYTKLPVRAAGLATQQTMQPIMNPSYATGTGNSTTWNVNVNANYQQTQVPATISADLLALQSML